MAQSQIFTLPHSLADKGGHMTHSGQCHVSCSLSGRQHGFREEHENERPSLMWAEWEGKQGETWSWWQSQTVYHHTTKAGFLLRASDWTARRSKQSILRETNPEHSLDGLMLKLKLYYFGHLMWRTDSLGKTPTLGKIDSRRRGRERTRWFDGIINSIDMSLSKIQEILKDREAWRAAVRGVTKCQIWLSKWTADKPYSIKL